MMPAFTEARRLLEERAEWKKRAGWGLPRNIDL